MATLTREEVAERALRATGALAAGQSPSAEDSDRAAEALDSVYAMLRKKPGLPFATSEIPEWAQPALINLTALELCAEWGIGGARLQIISDLATKGRDDLNTQMAAMRHPVPTRVDYF
jgi:hypothetical protein